jgi:hypothetical protein
MTKLVSFSLIFGMALTLVSVESAGATAESPTPTSFAGPALDGRALHGQELQSATTSSSVTANDGSTSGPGFLSVFQEYSAGPLSVSVDGAPPTSMNNGGFTFGIVAAGSHTITASQGSTTVATGTVVVPSGQDVTALIYLAVGGGPAISGFANTRSAPPIGQSTVVIRNTANTGPVDVYLNGSKIATALANTASAATDISLNVNAGPLDFVVTPTGQPVSDALSSQTGDLVAGDLLDLFLVGDSSKHPSSIGFLTNANPLGAGYRLYAADGGVFDYGNATFYGSLGNKHINKPIVGAATTPVGLGYWLVGSDGGVFSFGDADFYGSTGSLTLNKPIVGMSATEDGLGYWLVASDGGIFSFGDASFYGSTGNKHLNKPIVGMAVTPDGDGYWLVASDGGIFSFGDAKFYGSTGALALDKPIVAMVPTVDGRGYWLVASDGGVFAFGDANFYGAGSSASNGPIVSVITTPDSLGYWLVSNTGSIYSFGDADLYGSAGTIMLNKPVVYATDPGTALPT